MESEKATERKLCEEVNKLGGWAIKLLATQVTGLPDRLILLPGGRVYFVELKSYGKKPTKIQEIVHNKIRALGFDVLIIDSKEGVNNFIERVCEY